MFDYDADGNRIGRMVTTDCLGVRKLVEDQGNTISDKEVRVYPNPTDGSFKVLIPADIKNENSSYELYDINGVLISAGEIFEFETDIDVGDHPAGVYLLKITNGDDIISKIVLKQ